MLKCALCRKLLRKNNRSGLCSTCYNMTLGHLLKHNRIDMIKLRNAFENDKITETM